MKPFDLEKALAGEPVVTRSGEAVTQLRKFDGVDGSRALVGVLNRNICIWENTGRADFVGKSDMPGDLFMADKPKRTVRAYVRVQKKASRSQTPHSTTTALEIGEDEAIEPCDGWQTVEFDLEVEE